MLRFLMVGWIVLAVGAGGGAALVALSSNDPVSAVLACGITLVAILAALLVEQVRSRD